MPDKDPNQNWVRLKAIKHSVAVEENAFLIYGGVRFDMNLGKISAGQNRRGKYVE